jgi:phospholipid/cholesterol/gamma-HCH transport system substrate-binding protein
METRANYALVGVFTLAILAAAFAFVYWFSGIGGATKRAQVRIVFTGTVTGLNRGSNVLFNGLRVGEVSDIRLLPDDPQRIYVTADIERTTPVRTDTRARMEAQGLTGVVAIQLIGGEARAPLLLPTPGQPLPTIFAEKSEFQDLLETARTIAKRVDEVVGKVETLIGANEQSVTSTVRDIAKFSKALGDNSEGVDRLMKSVAQAADRIGPLAERLDKVSILLGDALSALDKDKIATIVADVQRFTGALGGSSADVAKSIKDVASITDKLNRAADQVEAVMKSAQAFLGSATGEEGKNTFASVGEAARSIRQLADNLDKRTAELAGNLNRFAGPGLRDIESLAADGRRTLTDINRTLRNIERNPQQFIFGGRPALPEYNGRR